MGVINFSKANCKNCYSCARACPIHAVRIKNEQAEIIEERCIACGKCLKACPQNAKQIKSELEVVKGFIRDNFRIAVSIAPSYVAAFGELSNKICSVLKTLGFHYVEETILGAESVTNEYNKFSKLEDEKCYITSCCSAVNLLIRKYYQDAIDNLIPVISPMECHGKMLKQKYGQDIKVVFIGPCLAKKLEAKEDSIVDAVLTFDELKRWFDDIEIDFSSADYLSFDSISGKLQSYPVVGGVTQTIRDNTKDFVHIDGLDECMEAIEAITKGAFKNTVIEMNLCRHGCIDGPAMPDNKINVYVRKQLIKRYAQYCENINTFSENFQIFDNIKLSKKFTSLYSPLEKPTDERIKEILMSIGKNTKLDELNCGTCGYKTCREKAIAVHNKMAEPTMCLPFMRQKAETLSSTIFDITPNIIVIIDKDLKIMDFNPSAEKFFNLSKGEVLGVSLSELIDPANLKLWLERNENIHGLRTYLPYQDATVLQSIIRIKSNEAALLIMQDISESVKEEEKIQKMKINSIEMAQQVIDKQMRVAQQIASLLGETTAETKVSLTKLKRLVQGEEVDLK